MTTVPLCARRWDIRRDAHDVTGASADGVTAGTAVHRSLILIGPGGLSAGPVSAPEARRRAAVAESARRRPRRLRI
jgi:hypothetical protein